MSEAIPPFGLSPAIDRAPAQRFAVTGWFRNR
jgi:Rps23 Pro-64 3,4-dihydroxylase Tpa1-like proline 4-hydroxylase